MHAIGIVFDGKHRYGYSIRRGSTYATMHSVKVDLREGLPEVLALHVGNLLLERSGHASTSRAGESSSTPRRSWRKPG